MTVTEGLGIYPFQQQTWYCSLKTEAKTGLALGLPALQGPQYKRKLPGPWHVQLQEMIWEALSSVLEAEGSSLESGRRNKELQHPPPQTPP